MDEINKIRKDFFTHKETKHEIAKKYNRSWSTIDRAVTKTIEELEQPSTRPNRKGQVITDEVIKAIKRYLDYEDEMKVKRKQRYKTKKIYEELKSQGIYQGQMRRLHDVICQMRKDRDQSKQKAFLPLSFELGSTIQVDHGEVDFIVHGQRKKGYLFVGSVPGYCLRYCQVFPIKSQEAWGEFHERLFGFFGGVFKNAVYDNDSVLIKEVIGNERKQTNFSLSLEEHFGIESHFCNVAAGHEKGSVENAVGYCRRNFFAGCLSFSNWEEINQQLEDFCHQDIEKGYHYKTQINLKEIYLELKQLLLPLPIKHQWSKSLDCKVNSYQLAMVDHHQYSVPEKYVGCFVRVVLGIFQVKIFRKEELIATHQRQYENQDSLILDHYLNQLEYKPAAFSSCKAVLQHRFPDSLLDFRQKLLDKHPKNEANQEFVRLLLLARKYSEKDLLQATKEAVNLGVIQYTAVENILYQKNLSQQLILQEKLSALTTVSVSTWSFDLVQYNQLVKAI